MWSIITAYMNHFILQLIDTKIGVNKVCLCDAIVFRDLHEYIHVVRTLSVIETPQPNIENHKFKGSTHSPIKKIKKNCILILFKRNKTTV